LGFRLDGFNANQPEAQDHDWGRGYTTLLGAIQQVPKVGLDDRKS
jgi:hypothetical protein